MVSIALIITIVWIHFIADFVLQSDKMAINKSSSNEWLFIHSAIYAAPFIIIGVQYAVINEIAHFVIDYITSRVTSKLYQAGERHWFFVVIGLDQAIHISILLITLRYAT